MKNLLISKTNAITVLVCGVAYIVTRLSIFAETVAYNFLG